MYLTNRLTVKQRTYCAHKHSFTLRTLTIACFHHNTRFRIQKDTNCRNKLHFVWCSECMHRMCPFFPLVWCPVQWFMCISLERMRINEPTNIHSTRLGFRTQAQQFVGIATKSTRSVQVCKETELLGCSDEVVGIGKESPKLHVHFRHVSMHFTERGPN